MSVFFHIVPVFARTAVLMLHQRKKSPAASSRKTLMVTLGTLIANSSPIIKPHMKIPQVISTVKISYGIFSTAVPHISPLSRLCPAAESRKTYSATPSTKEPIIAHIAV